MTRFQIPEKVLRALGSGGGGAEAMAILRRVETSKRMLLVCVIPGFARKAGHPHASLAARALVTLCEIEARAPEATHAVIGHPGVGGWAEKTANALQAGEDAEPGGLAAVAAAAAIRAGMDGSFDVPLRQGAVVLPSLGRALLPGQDGIAEVRLEAGNATVGGVRIPTPIHRDAPGWQAIRELHLEADGLSLRLLFDDVDPFRLPRDGCSDDRPDLTLWRDLLQQAWALLVRNHPAAAEEIASLITTLTPMDADVDMEASATLMCAFGTIGLSAPHDDRFLAVTLAHETQHAKLGAVMDAHPMTLPDDGRLFYAPWRDDPRPIYALLQGAYAFLGVTGFWRTQRGHEEGRRLRYADTEFARWRAGVMLVTRTLLTTGGLTAPGLLFVDEMMRTLEAWQQDPVPPEAAANASEANLKHLAEWRRRNGPPPPEQPLY